MKLRRPSRRRLQGRRRRPSVFWTRCSVEVGSDLPARLAHELANPLWRPSYVASRFYVAKAADVDEPDGFGLVKWERIDGDEDAPTEVELVSFVLRIRHSGFHHRLSTLAADLDGPRHLQALLHTVEHKARGKDRQLALTGGETTRCCLNRRHSVVEWAEVAVGRDRHDVLCFPAGFVASHARRVGGHPW